MEEFEQARRDIDQIDRQIAELFEKRMEAAARIAAWKQAHGKAIRDPAREEAMLAQTEARIGDPTLRPHYRRFLENLMARSRARQSELFAGAKGAVRYVDTERGGYPVFLERGALRKAASLLDLNRRVFVVTDDGIPDEYASALAAQCRQAVVHVVPRGEASKSPAVLTELLEAMLRFGLTRRDCALAVGGGVVGDLTGLAAALYMRGIEWYNLPTSLLAMADASVGGKTAVDLGGVKNAAGAFWQPGVVLIDPALLATLPARQLSNGLAEAVKMALTHDAALFARLEDPAGFAIDEIIADCLRIKASVVSADEREAGPRRALNFGHTLGHGLEAAACGRLLHGEAVALGMIPMCAPAVRERLLPVLERLGLPTYVNFDLDIDKALETITHDKKSTDHGVEIVTVPKIGQFSFRSVGLNELRPILFDLTNTP